MTFNKLRDVGIYVKHCKFSKREQERLIEYFVSVTLARTSAELIDIHRNSVIRFFLQIAGEGVKQEKFLCKAGQVSSTQIIIVLIMLYMYQNLSITVFNLRAIC